LRFPPESWESPLQLLKEIGLVVLAACCIFFAAAVSAASRLDPWNLEGATAPAPNQAWIPDKPLPELTLKDVLKDIPVQELNRPLSLAELTDLALGLNLRTRQAWLQARADAYSLGIERADAWPQINGLYNWRIGRQISNTTGLPVPVQTAYGPSVSLSYILYDFGQRAADIEAAGFRLLAANLGQNRVLQEVAFQVEQAYYRVLALDHLVRASRESLKNFETALDAAQRRRASGLATAGDEYRAETQVGQSRLVLTRNEGDLAKARGLLASAVGLPVDFRLQLESVTALPPVSEITQSMDALLAKAKSNRPDLVAAEARARAAQAAARSVSKAGLPSLEFTANYGVVNFTNGAPGTPYPQGTRRPEQEVYQFGLNLRIPLFSGFRDTYSVRRAQQLAEQAENARDQLANQTELEVWQAYFDLQTSASSVASTANLVRSAGESADAAVARYKAGMGSLLDLITAQLDDTNAQVQRIQSYLDWYSALSRLNFALGATDSAARGSKTP
jgi:outer membrane protein